VTASGSAVTGTQTLSVKSVASSGYMTGAKIGATDGTDTMLSDLGYKGEATSFNVKLGDGTVKTIDVSKTTKLSDIVSSLQGAGLNASFDTNQNRFYVSSKTTGKAADFEITSSGDDSYNALYALGLLSDKTITTGKASETVKVSLSGTYADGTAVSTSLSVTFADPASEDEADAQNALVEALKNGKMKVSSPDNMALSYTFGENDEFSMETVDGVTGIYKDGKKVATVEDFQTTGLKSEADGSLADFSTITWGTAKGTGGSTATFNRATKLDGTDASITLNGVEYTGTTNSFSINGLSINALAKTDGDITITTTTDTQAIYDKIKDFLTEYNSVINEMTKLYNADSSYGYDPLTDDEKDAMSDTEIEKWETKIKDSLLRNDTTLNGVMMAMINSMSTAYTINGQKYSLSTFGIGTLGYLNAVENENYAYHIDGDSDDDNTSSKDDKLMTAITEDPDTVIEFMKQLTSGLYTSLGNKMKSTTLSSAYTIYNDKEMNSQYSEYSKTISKWEDKLSDKEDYYYNKFSKMESALTQLQSQTNSLSGLFSS
jgi:flagellar hook-associated protein 2